MLGVSLRRGMGVRGMGRNLDADRLVTSGLTEEAIAKICQMCGKGWTNYYYKKTGQLPLYHASKPGYLNYVAFLIATLINEIQKPLRNFDEQSSNLVQIIQTVVYYKASDAEKRTWEYLQSVSRTKHSWELLETVYRRYYAAIEKGEKKTLAALCRGLDIYPSEVSWILNKVNLRPLGKPKRRITREEREVLGRAFYINMSISDITYFIPYIPPSTIALNFSKMGMRPRAETAYLGIVKTHKFASEVYSIIDEDSSLSLEEIAEYLGKPIRRVKEAVRLRNVIEPIIIRALRVMYSDPQIDKPYLHPI